MLTEKKPIFHCDAKYLASGVGVGQCTRRQNFALPSQWNISCVGSLALGLCVGHVHFLFFVLILFALGSRRKRSFQWNMGLRLWSTQRGRRTYS